MTKKTNLPLFKRPGKSYRDLEQFKTGAKFFYGADTVEFIESDEVYLAVYIRRPDDPNEPLTDRHKALLEKHGDSPIGVFNKAAGIGKVIKENDE